MISERPATDQSDFTHAQSQQHFGQNKKVDLANESNKEDLASATTQGLLQNSKTIPLKDSKKLPLHKTFSAVF